MPVPEFMDKIYENKLVIDSLKEIENAEKILQATGEDVKDERMSQVRFLEERDLHESALARRLAVHEFRDHLGPAGVWRLRMVDHHANFSGEW